MNLIPYRALRTFLNAQVLPDQLGGQFPQIKIVDSNRPPRIEYEVRKGKKDKRMLVVGVDWIVQQSIREIIDMKDKYS